MSPRQKTALKNRAPGDLPEGDSDTFETCVEADLTKPTNKTSSTLTTKQRRKKEGIPKEEFGNLSKGDTVSTQPLAAPPPSHASSSKNSSTIDSSPTSSKEFIDALTDSGGRNALQLVAKAKGRSQQLTFDALIKGATKLELCSLKVKPNESQDDHGRDGNIPTSSASNSPDKDQLTSGKKRKKTSNLTSPIVKTNNAVEKMESALKGLGKLEGEVMNALFPTDGSLPQSYELIANRFGMTVEEVKGIADNALRGLRGVKGPNGRISTVWN